MALVDKVFVGIFIGILALFGFAVFLMHESEFEPVGQVSLGGVVVNVEVADSPEEREVGLSGRNTLAENNGMLFIFPQEGEWSFWMKDTLIPLDIVWADAEGKIVTIAKNVRPESYPESYTSSVPARFVLEVNAGFTDMHNIVEGMQLVVQ